MNVELQIKYIFNLNSVEIMIAHNKRFSLILRGCVLLLLIPLIAMQFTAEVNWNIADFLVAGVLLLGTGLLGDQIWRKAKNNKRKVLLTLGLIVLLLLLWAELGVGIFGSPLAGS